MTLPHSTVTYILTWKSPLCRWANTRGGGEGQEGSGLAREGRFQTAEVHTEPMNSQDSRTQVRRKDLEHWPPGGR